jgi:hypothetical protein
LLKISLILSFVVQNFYQHNPFLIKTYRYSKLILLKENLFLIYFLIYNLSFFRNPNKVLNLKIFIFFKKKILKYFYLFYKNALKFKSSFYINNLTKSFIFWFIKPINYFLRYNKFIVMDIFVKGYSTTLDYSQPITLVKFPWNRLYYNRLIFLYINLIVSFYFNYIYNYKLFYNFIFILNNFYVLPFLNIFYFKLRHI